MPTTAVTPSTASALPPRPHDVQLRGVDPCSLITPEIRAELYGLSDKVSHDKALDKLDSSDCTTTNLLNTPVDAPIYGLGVRLVFDQNATQERGDNLNPTTVTTIGGFGAIQQPGLADNAGNQSCLFVIDTSDTQSLWVSFGLAGHGSAPPGYAAMCAKARPAAESVLAQLLARTS
jgi:hypothetical protein